MGAWLISCLVVLGGLYLAGLAVAGVVMGLVFGFAAFLEAATRRPRVPTTGAARRLARRPSAMPSVRRS